MIVAPFRPLRYRTARAGRMEDLVSPPYDVIGSRYRLELARRNPFNVVRLILPGGGGGRFSRAARLLEKWQRQGILTRDARPGLFPAVQEFRIGGRGDIRRLGFFGLLGFPGNRSGGTVLAHERTFSGPRKDREQMLQACRADLEAILLLYSDPAGTVEKLLRRAIRKRPFTSFREEDESRCRVWKMEESPATREIQAAMRRKDLLIADGHHRFASSSAFWSGLGDGSGNGDGAMQAGILAFFCRVEDPGVISLATHRCVSGIPAGRLRDLIPWLRRRYRVHCIANGPAGTGLSPGNEWLDSLGGSPPAGFRFGVRVRGQANTFLVCSPDRRKNGRRIFRPGVEDLEDRVLSRYLDLPSSSRRRVSRVSYLRDGREAISMVDRNQTDAAFLLEPIPPRKVFGAARDGRLFPPKSTFFFPKLPSGVVIRPFRD